MQETKLESELITFYSVLPFIEYPDTDNEEAKNKMHKQKVTLKHFIIEKLFGTNLVLQLVGLGKLNS